MPGIILIGAQWGDEGKGKATDLIGSHVDYVARFNGGNYRALASQFRLSERQIRKIVNGTRV